MNRTDLYDEKETANATKQYTFLRIFLTDEHGVQTSAEKEYCQNDGQMMQKFFSATSSLRNFIARVAAHHGTERGIFLLQNHNNDEEDGNDEINSFKHDERFRNLRRV